MSQALYLRLMSNSVAGPKADPPHLWFLQVGLRLQRAKTEKEYRAALQQVQTDGKRGNEIHKIARRGEDIFLHLQIILQFEYFHYHTFKPKDMLDLKKGAWLVSYSNFQI